MAQKFYFLKLQDSTGAAAGESLKFLASSGTWVIESTNDDPRNSLAVADGAWGLR
jgi:hypothetical protein